MWHLQIAGSAKFSGPASMTRTLVCGSSLRPAARVSPAACPRSYQYQTTVRPARCNVLLPLKRIVNKPTIAAMTSLRTNYHVVEGPSHDAFWGEDHGLAKYSRVCIVCEMSSSGGLQRAVIILVRSTLTDEYSAGSIHPNDEYVERLQYARLLLMPQSTMILVLHVLHALSKARVRSIPNDTRAHSMSACIMPQHSANIEAIIREGRYTSHRSTDN